MQRSLSTVRVALLALTGVVVSACADSAPAPADVNASAVQFTEANWQPKREADIPADSMGASVRRGLYLLRFTPESLPQYATSGLRCTSCHQDDGIKLTAGPLTGSHARFPKYMPRTGAVITLADRVNYCFTRSLAGNVLPVESREMTDLLAYMAFISQDVPVSYRLAGHDGLIKMPEQLDGDVARGAQLYVEKTCSACHGAEGDGLGVLPPLWGPRAYSIGASMSRIERAASFIYHNMPQTAPGSLTPQEALTSLRISTASRVRIRPPRSWIGPWVVTQRMCPTICARVTRRFARRHCSPAQRRAMRWCPCLRAPRAGSAESDVAQHPPCRDQCLVNFPVAR